MDERERMLEIIKSYRKTSARQHHSFRSIQNEIFDVLKEMNITTEIVDYLKATLIEAKKTKLELMTNIERETPELLVDEFYIFPDLESLNELITSLEGRLKTYEEIAKLEGVESLVSKNAKLKWKASPSIFGYLIFELAQRGYIDFPLYNGEINFAGLAKMSFELFDIETTKENLIKEINPNSNSLSKTKRAKFTIPELKDIS